MPFPLPGIGVVVAVISLTALGFFTANIFGRTIIRIGEAILNRMPLIRNVYAALKQIFETAAVGAQPYIPPRRADRVSAARAVGARLHRHRGEGRGEPPPA